MKGTWTNIYHRNIVFAWAVCEQVYCFFFFPVHSGWILLLLKKVMRKFLHSFSFHFGNAFFVLACESVCVCDSCLTLFFFSVEISSIHFVFATVTSSFSLFFSQPALMPSTLPRHSAPIYLFTLFNGMDHCSSFIHFASLFDIIIIFLYISGFCMPSRSLTLARSSIFLSPRRNRFRFFFSLLISSENVSMIWYQRVYEEVECADKRPSRIQSYIEQSNLHTHTHAYIHNWCSPILPLCRALNA